MRTTRFSQAHFALQQLSNTFLTREKGQERSGGAGEEPLRPRLSPRGQRPASPGPGPMRSAARAEPGCGADPGLPGRAQPLPVPAPAPRPGSTEKNSIDLAGFKLGREGRGVPGVPGGAAMLRGGGGRWDRGGQQLGPSPWRDASLEQVAFSERRLRAFSAGDPQFSHLPAVPAEAEHLSRSREAGWGGCSAPLPLPPGQFLPIPGTLGHRCSVTQQGRARSR